MKAKIVKFFEKRREEKKKQKFDNFYFFQLSIRCISKKFDTF